MVISTIHAAKGLEWDFVPRFVEDFLPCRYRKGSEPASGAAGPAERAAPADAAGPAAHAGQRGNANGQPLQVAPMYARCVARHPSHNARPCLPVPS